jgi:hypothetical protein
MNLLAATSVGYRKLRKETTPGIYRIDTNPNEINLQVGLSSTPVPACLGPGGVPIDIAALHG